MLNVAFIQDFLLSSNTWPTVKDLNEFVSFLAEANYCFWVKNDILLFVVLLISFFLLQYGCSKHSQASKNDKIRQACYLFILILKIDYVGFNLKLMFMHATIFPLKKLEMFYNGGKI